MSDIIFLTLEQILAIHDSQIEIFGGRHGIRDLTLLESALFRPQTTFGGEDLYLSLFEKAAVLMHSLIMNHPFIDGNKRTGIASALTFLEINSYRVTTTQNKLVKVVLDLEAGKLDIEQMSTWLKSNSRKF